MGGGGNTPRSLGEDQTVVTSEARPIIHQFTQVFAQMSDYF